MSISQNDIEDFFAKFPSKSVLNLKVDNDSSIKPLWAKKAGLRNPENASTKQIYDAFTNARTAASSDATASPAAASSAATSPGTTNHGPPLTPLVRSNVGLDNNADESDDESDDSDENFTLFNETIEVLRTALHSQSSAITNKIKKITELAEANINHLNEQISLHQTTSNSKQQEIDGHLEQISKNKNLSDEEIASLNTTIGKLNNDVSKLHKKIDTFKEQRKTLIQSIADMTSNLPVDENLQTELEKLENTVKKNGGSYGPRQKIHGSRRTKKRGGAGASNRRRYLASLKKLSRSLGPASASRSRKFRSKSGSRSRSSSRSRSRSSSRSRSRSKGRSRSRSGSRTYSKSRYRRH